MMSDRSGSSEESTTDQHDPVDLGAGPIELKTKSDRINTAIRYGSKLIGILTYLLLAKWLGKPNKGS